MFQVPLSIITINLNNAKGLSVTMESVFLQTFKDFEYIIIDGGSTDGSYELIKNHANKLAYWVSENDQGIYNAMNKGIMIAKGEYLLFLNSGDFLITPNSLSCLFANKNVEDIICADIIINSYGNITVRKAPDSLSFDYFMEETLPHQSAIIKRALFTKVGFYSEELKLVSDWKFYIDAFCKFGASYKHLPVTISEYNFDGITSRSENAKALEEERKNILKNEYSLFYEDYKQYHENTAQLNNYRNSRTHRLVDVLMKTPLYQFIKKIIN